MNILLGVFLFSDMADGLDARVENLKVDDSGDKLYKKMYDDEIDGP